MFTPIAPFSNTNPYGSPFTINPLIPVVPVVPAEQPQNPSQPVFSVAYGGDASGCFFYRMGTPHQLLNYGQELIVYDFTRMILDPKFYDGVKSIRVQRQATPHQQEFVRFLKQISQKNNCHIIYDVDDIIFGEDIPEYNKFKHAFTDPLIRKTSQEIIEMCDEMCVTCDFMADYFKSKTSQQNVTVIPNYPPRWWIGDFYNEREIGKRFDKHRHRPRILYPGSGAHFDVDARVKFQDDFYHVNDAVIKTRKEFKWVFIGAFPFALRPYIQSGEIEYHPWCTLFEYPRFVNSLEVNAFVAPLQDNTFNKAKSDIKYIEACSLGLPAALQNLCTYQNAPFKFNTGDEMIDLLKSFFKFKDNYMKISTQARKIAEGRFLENKNNIGKYKEMMLFKHGSPERVLLS